VLSDLFFNIDAELKLHGYDDAVLVKYTELATYIVLLVRPAPVKHSSTDRLRETNPYFVRRFIEE
jgi:hypothetical protein